jgi:hypothetical protein
MHTSKRKKSGKMGSLPNRIGRLIVRKKTIGRNKLGERICFDATLIARDSAYGSSSKPV